jgi:hypothetical protein
MRQGLVVKAGLVAHIMDEICLCLNFYLLAASLEPGAAAGAAAAAHAPTLHLPLITVSSPQALVSVTADAWPAPSMKARTTKPHARKVRPMSRQAGVETALWTYT